MVSLSWSGVVWYSKNCVILKIQPVVSEPSNLGTSSFIRCGAASDPDASNEDTSGCACGGLNLLASRCASLSDKVSIFASIVAANFVNNSSIFSDDKAFDLVPSAMRQNLCSMKAPMIPSVRGLGNLHTARDPRESSKLAGKKKTRVQREREGAQERKETSGLSISSSSWLQLL